MTIYLGPVGNLVALPSIGRGIAANLTVPAAVHQLAGRGGRVVDRFPGASARTYVLARAYLTADELTILEAMYLGAYGPGPFVLVEPWRRNMLTPNQSAATDVLADTTGFANVNAVSIATSTAQADLGLRSLAISMTAINQVAGTGNIASTATADPDTDVPVLPSTSYAAQVRARLSASTGTFRTDIYWYTAAGVLISSSTGGPVGLSTSAFTSTTCVATSPSTAALARVLPRLTIITGTPTVYTDKWQLEQASAAGAWTIGTGVPRVSFTDDMAESYNVAGYMDAGFTLTEVGTS